MKADLHVHSTFSSDGRQTVEEILARCVELGIGAVAISDHNSIESFQVVGRLCPTVIVIPAVEVSTKDGHVLALGVRDLVPRGLTLKETIDAIHGNGGVAVAAHPYRKWSGMGERNAMDNVFDAMEVANGGSRRSGNKKARRLAESLGRVGVGGSDAHNRESIGRAYTEVPDDCRSPSDVLHAILEGRCRAVGQGQSWFQAIPTGLKSIVRWLRRGLRRM